MTREETQAGTPADATEDRFTAVEMKLAWMENYVRQLQDRVLELSRQVEKVDKENEAFREKIRDLSDALEDIPNRRPPHY